MNRKLIYVVLTVGLVSVQGASAGENISFDPEGYDYTDYTGDESTWIEPRVETSISKMFMVSSKNEAGAREMEKSVRNERIQSNDQ